jgi:puromycin-sensitive aminopeptidase
VTERPPYRLPRHVLPQHYAVTWEPDFANASFSGEETVDLEVKEATSELVLHAVELDLAGARVLVPGGRELEAKVSYVPEEEQAVLSFGEALRPGPAQLQVRFSGKLNDLLRGFYRSKYKGPEGKEAWVAVTQFESTDARRAFPCWDEPDLKATFQVTVVADGDLTALSNARELSSEVLADGRKRTRFADTIKMSTYLVAVAIGPFRLTDAKIVEGVPLRVGCAPGRENLVGFAEKAAAHALSFLSGYFSLPYPGDKLDHVAVPDFAAGAMENLGLVTYRETALLVPEASAQVERQRVASVVAHETSHMWFGDLVTMRWWEGIWLNEAFATFMELLSTDAFEPRWEIWTSFGADRLSALGTDSLRASRAIEYPVGRPEEADDMFDTITYDKGCSVLRMIERYLGDETFRRGLRIYLERHQFANTKTTDLWDALEEASGVPVTTTMGSWVGQAGHPLVSATLSGPATLQLSQQRFLLDGGENAGERWVVPVTLRYGTAGGTRRHQLLLDGPSAAVTLEAEPDWVLVNEGAWGVYRSGYSDELRERLVANLDQLDARERLGLAGDTWSLAVAGKLPLGAALALWGRLREDRDPDVWWSVQGGLGLLDLVCLEKERPLVQQLARTLGSGLFASLGWPVAASDGNEEPPRTARLRSRLVALLGTLGHDEAVRDEARRRLEAASSGGPALPPDLATAVAQVVAAGGSEAEWDLLYARYKEATTPQDEIRYLMALAGFAEPALLSRSLELAFSGEVRTQDAPFLVMGVLGQREGCTIAWDALEAHWEDVLARWPKNAMPRVLEALPSLAAGGEGAARRAAAWIDAHPVPRGGLKVAQSLERLQVNLAFAKRVAPDLAQAVEGALSGAAGGPAVRVGGARVGGAGVGGAGVGGAGVALGAGGPGGA